jgi:hypothetical protein
MSAKSTPDAWLVVGQDAITKSYYPITMRRDKAEADVIATLRDANRSEHNQDIYTVMSPADATACIKLPWDMIELLVKASSDVT